MTLPDPSRTDRLAVPSDDRRLATEATPAGSRGNQTAYDDDVLDRLADLLADRLVARLSGLSHIQPEPLVDAAEIARLHGRTRSWVYDHAGELGAVRLGSGPRPRLGFSLARVAEQLEKVDKPVSTPMPQPPQRRHRRQRAGRTSMGAPLLRVRSAGT